MKTIRICDARMIGKRKGSNGTIESVLALGKETPRFLHQEKKS
jgi:hypothetical protein